MTKERVAMLQMVCCAIMWSLSGVFVKLIPWNAMAISGARCFFTALVFYFYMRYKKIPVLINKRTLLTGVFVALIYATYTPAVKMVTSATAIVLQYTAPIYILLYVSVKSKKLPLRSDVIAVFCTIAGMAVFFFDQLGGGSMLGVLLAVISGVFLAGMHIIVGDSSEPERFSGLLLAQVFAVLTGIPFFFTEPLAITPVILLYIVILGVVQLAIPYILYIFASRYCPPLMNSLLSVIEPLLNPTWVFLFVGERPSALSLFGGAIVLASVTIWCVYQEKQRARAALPAPDSV